MPSETGQRRRLPVVIGVVAVVVLLALAALVSWPWHHHAWSRAELDLAAQRHAGDEAHSQFCTSLLDLEAAAQRAERASARSDPQGVAEAVMSIEAAFASARASAAHAPKIDDVAALRRPVDDVLAAQHAAGASVPPPQPFRGHLDRLSGAVQRAGVRADCATFG